MLPDFMLLFFGPETHLSDDLLEGLLDALPQGLAELLACVFGIWGLGASEMIS